MIEAAFPSPPRPGSSPPRTPPPRAGGFGAYDDDDDVAAGFGPPPAFPRRRGDGRRPRTLLAVSAAAADEAGGVLPPADAGDGDGRGAPDGGTPPPSSHARLLTSLSEDAERSPGGRREEEAAAPPSSATPEIAAAGTPPREAAATAHHAGGATPHALTPLRSNVHPDPLPVESATSPWSGLPKPRTRHPPHPGGGCPMTTGGHPAASHVKSPDGRDPKVARTTEEGAREGHAPMQPHLPPGGGAAPDYHHPHRPGPSHHPPPSPSQYGGPAPVPSAPGYGPPYYPPHPPQLVSSSGSAPPSPYHPTRHHPARPPPHRGGGGPAFPRWALEPVHSSSAGGDPRTLSPGGYPSAGGSPYGAPPPPPTDGYHYPPPEYSALATPPRGPPDPHRPYGPPPPGYGPPHVTPPQGYHHRAPPDAPPGLSPPGGYPPPHPYYRRAGPLSAAHDPYEPLDHTAARAEARFHVPATVSHEVDPADPHPRDRPGAAAAVAVPPAPPPPRPPPAAPASAKFHQFRKGGRGVHSEPIILRKKFSWRNYPELEEFLIAHRADYLRHSALNYTAEQKHFNNRLTEGLLELAAGLNYVFDETCFNFVAVRDRIRCYYKSYVQSSKKRGVVVGFPRQRHRLPKEEPPPSPHIRGGRPGSVPAEVLGE